MMTRPASRGTPRRTKATPRLTRVRATYQTATARPAALTVPSPIAVAGRRKPATALIVLLFIASLRVAAPRPRRARYTAATALGRLVTAARITAPTTALDRFHRSPRSVTLVSIRTDAITTTTTAMDT